MADLVGKTIRGYEIREMMGRGGFGAVYRAYQPTVAREVAVKVILPEFASQPEFVLGFEIEAQLVARLEHPHIVPLFDYWTDADGAFIVMRMLKGGSLRDLVDQGAITLSRTAHIMDQICGALTVAHRGGVVHRDLKPDNILLDEDGNAYLTDFGIAKPVGHSMSQDNISGSIPYMAPEQLMGDAPSPLADIYSLGIMVYEMLAGRHPFEALTPTQMMLKHLNEPLPDPVNVPDDVYQPLRIILNRMTAKTPTDRYESALEVAQAFRQMLNQKPITENMLNLIPPDAKQSEIIQNHLDGLYRRLDGLYERMAGTENESSLISLRSEIQQLQIEIDYRTSRLFTVEEHAPLNLPPTLLAPSAPSYEVVGVQKMVDIIKERLFGDKSVVLLGASGVGKSELAALIARDPDVQFHFENRIVWFPVGKNADVFGVLGEWLLALGVPDDKFAGLTTLEQRRKQFQETTGKQRMLVVTDDLWKLDDLKNSVLDARNRLVYVVTTRLAEVASDLLWEIVRLDALLPENRTKLLQELVSELQTDDDNVQKLVERIGGLPRDLILLGTRLRRAGTSASRLRREIDKISESPADVLEQGYASLSSSVEALSENARKAFRSIALLPPEPNTFSEDAGDAIVGDLEYLDELVDYSLLKVDNERYTLHPSFAEYARTYLELDKEAPERIVDYYLDYAQKHPKDYNALARESRNIEAALQIAMDQNLDEALVKAVLALASFWSVRGLADVASKFLTHAYDLPAVKPLQRAELALYRAQIEERQSNPEQSEHFVQAGLKLLGDQPQGKEAARLKVLLTEQMAGLAFLKRDVEKARTLWTTALEEAQQQRNFGDVSMIYNNLANLMITTERNAAGAKDYYLKSLEAAKQAKDDSRRSLALQNLGLLESWYFNDVKQAKAYLNESWEIAREIGHVERISGILMNRGHVEMMQNNLEQARMHYEEGLQKARLSHNSEAVGYGLLLLGNIVISLSEYEDAEKHLRESLEIALKREDINLLNDIVNVILKNGEARIVAMAIPDDADAYEKVLEAARLHQLEAVKVAKLENLVKRLTSPFTNPKAAISLAQLNLGLIEGREFNTFDQAAIHFTESARLAREAEDNGLLAQALYELSYAYMQQNNLPEVEKTLSALFDLLTLDEAVLNPVIDLLSQFVDAKRGEGQTPVSPELMEKAKKATG
ncbi:MAG: protein kinase, partial [Anaerolineae bacterium]|nr:protein kinase [Anaerolineae bacterium]